MLISFTIHVGTVDGRNLHFTFRMDSSLCSSKTVNINHFFLLLPFSRIDQSRIPSQCHALHPHHCICHFGFSFFCSLESPAPVRSILPALKPKTHITCTGKASRNSASNNLVFPAPACWNHHSSFPVFQQPCSLPQIHLSSCKQVLTPLPHFTQQISLPALIANQVILHFLGKVRDQLPLALMILKEDN